MDQIEVEVRGTINPWHWSPRLFSVSAPRGVVAISRKNHTEDWSHRCVHVTNVQMWPHYDAKHIHFSMDSMEAMLTLRVHGSEVRAITDVGTTNDTHALLPTPQVLGFTQRGFHVGSYAWMVRFFSYECLERAVKLLQTIPVGAFIEETIEGGQHKGNPESPMKHQPVVEATMADADAGHPDPVSTAAAAADIAHTATETNPFAVPHENSATTTTTVTTQDSNAYVDFGAGRRASRSASVIDGDVEVDMETIHAAWEHRRRAPFVLPHA